jgi:DnaJ-domain-containing protein 1
MTQSGQAKKSLEPLEASEEIKEAPKKAAPKSKLDALIEQLKAEKPEVYEQYVAAIKNRRPAWVYPDLTVRIG